jgi:hypothetical protein
VAIVLGALVLLVFLGFGVFALVHRSSSAFPDVGDCIQLSKDDLVNGDFAKVPCGDQRALYRVDSRHEGDAACPGDYAPFVFRDEESGPVRVTLCMELNVNDGDCLTSLDDRTKAKKVSCDSTEAKQRVAVRQGVADDSACGLDEGFVLYPGSSPHTLCMSALPKKTAI